MSRKNNVDVESIQRFAEQIEQETNKAKKTQVMEGEWLLGEGGPQFRSKIKYEGGEVTFEADNPTFMGGGGSLPGPMHYCFFGLASCYTGIFAAAAASLGIELKKLATRVEADVNFAQVFGVEEAPIMEEIRVILSVASDASESRIQEAERMALERCPVVYTLRNQVKLEPKIEIVAG